MASGDQSVLDPITLEVLRHRLWMINDEQGLQLDFMARLHGIRSFEGLRSRGRAASRGTTTPSLTVCIDPSLRT